MAGLASAAALVQSASAAPVAPTASQALARHRAMTSIGPDPCRAATSEEIVVCGRRESPYALPLYDPMADDEFPQAGRAREETMDRMKDTGAPCRARGEPCIRGLPVLTLKF